MKKRARVFVFFVCIVFLGSIIRSVSNQLHAQYIEGKTSVYCSNNEGAPFGKCFLDVYFDVDENGLPTNSFDDMINAIDAVQESEMPMQDQVEIYATFHSEKRENASGDVVLNAFDMKTYATYSTRMSDMLKRYGKMPTVRESETIRDLSGFEVEGNELAPGIFDDCSGGICFRGVSKIIMPKNITTIKDQTFPTWDSEITLEFPATLTTIEEQAFSASSYSNIDLIFLGDTSTFIENIVNKKFKSIKIDAEVNDALLTSTPFANANIQTLEISGNLSDPDKVFDLNQMYGPTNRSLASLIVNDGYAKISATGFTNLKKVRIQGNIIFTLDLHDNAIDDVSDIRTDYSSTVMDVSGNKIDFTNSLNAPFYAAYTSNANVTLNKQKPILYIKDNLTNVTITDLADLDFEAPTFAYADASAVDFTQAAPNWIDPTYYDSYASKVSLQFYDNYYQVLAKEDITSDGTYYYDYVYDNTVSVTKQGKKRMTVQLSQEEIVKETPTISLTNNPNANIVEDQDITLTATLSSTQGKDVNNNATVTFYDGSTSLGSVNLANDKAEVVKQFTSGVHTITATYSGNVDFESVTSSSLSMTVSEPGNPGKQPQTLSFANSEVNCIYGDVPASNTATLTQPHSTGSITYRSDNPQVATVDASTGVVSVLKAGVAKIYAEVAEDATYNAAQAFYTLTADKRVLTLNNLKVKDKVYDGKKDAEFDTSLLTVGNVLQEDAEKISLIQGSVSFSNADAGTQKEMIIEDMMLHGDASVISNYSLTIPSLYGVIQKKNASIKADELTKQQGEANPQLTYTISGLLATDKESTLSDYTKPALTTTANQSSAIGDYTIQVSGANARNYTFTYQPGVLHVKAADEPLTNADYRVEGTKGKNDWYVSNVTIKPSNGYTKIWDGSSWKSQLTLQQGVHKDIEFKLQKADGTQSKVGTLPTVQIDTTPPVTDNIKDGSTYLLNRLFYIVDDYVHKVTVNGSTISDFNKGVLLDGDKETTYKIEVEDKAGNTTSMSVQMTPLSTVLSKIDTLNEENVSIENQAEIEALLKQVQDLLDDDTYSPSETQKAKLLEVEATCTSLLTTISQQEGVNPGTSNTDVSTGDTTSLIMISLLMLSSFYMILLVYRRRNLHNLS